MLIVMLPSLSPRRKPLMPPDLYPEALIELERATVMRAGQPALQDVSLRIGLGQHTVILGPNGCGKSTFVRLIDRSLYPLARPEGRPPVRVFGKHRWDVSELRTRLGVVSASLSEELGRLKGLDVEDTVVSGFWGTSGLPSHRVVTTAMRERSQQMLEQMQISHLRHRTLDALSAGEARRALIARALVHQPQALILDEPSTGLDIAARSQLLDLLRGLTDQGVTLVLVTHHLEEILPEMTQAILLRAGSVFRQGHPADVLNADALSSLYGIPLQLGLQPNGFRYLLPAT